MPVDTVAIETSCGTTYAMPFVPSLLHITVTDPRLEYCCALTRDNMSPYLNRLEQRFSEGRWRSLAPQASFYLIVDSTITSNNPWGFLSVRDDPDAPTALHIGDIQLEAQHHGRGIGSKVLELVDKLARSLNRAEITLNVFHDNTRAKRLYERCGFREIDTQLDKLTMRKTL